MTNLPYDLSRIPCPTCVFDHVHPRKLHSLKEFQDHYCEVHMDKFKLFRCNGCEMEFTDMLDALTHSAECISSKKKKAVVLICSAEKLKRLTRATRRAMNEWATVFHYDKYRISIQQQRVENEKTILQANGRLCSNCGKSVNTAKRHNNAPEVKACSQSLNFPLKAVSLSDLHNSIEQVYHELNDSPPKAKCLPRQILNTENVTENVSHYSTCFPKDIPIGYDQSFSNIDLESPPQLSFELGTDWKHGSYSYEDLHNDRRIRETAELFFDTNGSDMVEVELQHQSISSALIPLKQADSETDKFSKSQSPKLLFPLKRKRSPSSLFPSATSKKMARTNINELESMRAEKDYLAPKSSPRSKLASFRIPKKVKTVVDLENEKREREQEVRRLEVEKYRKLLKETKEKQMRGRQLQLDQRRSEEEKERERIGAERMKERQSQIAEDNEQCNNDRDSAFERTPIADHSEMIATAWDDVEDERRPCQLDELPQHSLHDDLAKSSLNDKVEDTVSYYDNTHHETLSTVSNTKTEYLATIRSEGECLQTDGDEAKFISLGYELLGIDKMDFALKTTDRKQLVYCLTRWPEHFVETESMLYDILLGVKPSASSNEYHAPMSQENGSVADDLQYSSQNQNQDFAPMPDLSNSAVFARTFISEICRKCPGYGLGIRKSHEILHDGRTKVNLMISDEMTPLFSARGFGDTECLATDAAYQYLYKNLKYFIKFPHINSEEAWRKQLQTAVYFISFVFAKREGEFSGVYHLRDETFRKNENAIQMIEVCRNEASRLFWHNHRSTYNNPRSSDGFRLHYKPHHHREEYRQNVPPNDYSRNGDDHSTHRQSSTRDHKAHISQNPDDTVYSKRDGNISFPRAYVNQEYRNPESGTMGYQQPLQDVAACTSIQIDSRHIEPISDDDNHGYAGFSSSQQQLSGSQASSNYNVQEAASYLSHPESHRAGTNTISNDGVIIHSRGSYARPDRTAHEYGSMSYQRVRYVGVERDYNYNRGSRYGFNRNRGKDLPRNHLKSHSYQPYVRDKFPNDYRPHRTYSKDNYSSRRGNWGNQNSGWKGKTDNWKNHRRNY